MLAGAREAQTTLVTASTDAASQVKSLAADIERSLSMAGAATAESITAGAREAQSTLVNASTDATTQVKSLAADVERALSMAGTATAEAITAGARDAQSTLVNASTAAAEQVKSLAADMQRSLSMAGTSTAEAITAGAREAQNTLVTASSDAASQVKSLTADVQRTLSIAGNSTAESITTGARDAQNTLVSASTAAAENVKSLAADVERTLTAVGADVERTLTAVGQNTASSILTSARDAQIHAELGGHGDRGVDPQQRQGCAGFADDGGPGDRNLAAQQHTRSAELADRDLRRRREPDQVDLGRYRAVARRRHREHHGQHPDHAQNAQSALVAASNEVSSKIKTTSADIERSVLAASSAFGSTMTGKTDEIVTYVQQQADRLAQIVDSRRGQLVEALTSKTTQLATDIGRVTADALKAIETRGKAFSQTMSTNGSEIARTINSASDVATGAVNKSLKDIELASRSAIDQSRQVSVAAVTEMQETSKILRTDTVALFERLREGNILLQEVLTGAHDNLNSLEQALVSRVADFVSAMNDVSSRNGVATQTLEEQIRASTPRPPRRWKASARCRASSIPTAARWSRPRPSSSRATSNTSETLEERKGVLESLATTLDLRTADLDQRLSRFTGLLDELMAAAEDRARDIARVVAETAGAGSAAISQQFEAVRAAPKRNGIDLDAMSELYQQGMAETDAMFRQATEKFSSIVQAMRQMASEMQNELEATRNELRRGVLEMPQEAAESTAQMRKVIVDQIEALAELNRIVAHHGRGLDVVTQSRASAPPAPGRTCHGGCQRRTRGVDTRGSASTLPPPDLGMPAGRRTEAPPVSPVGPDGGRDGWLSDLLSRTDANGNQPQRGRAPQQAAPDNPLASLSLDIGRLMDRNLAAEMWDRYQRGESKAFSKRLYTPAGQKAFDEVARKYRADRGFKQTVDRYITEFERLLDEVAREDRGPQALRGHLASETGLVYTLLAHASGRLG